MHETSKGKRELTVGQLLAQVCRMTGHHLRTHMEKIGLHRGQGFALFHLWHHDGVPQCELAQAMHVSPASVTNMLQRMERDGWIARERDEEDQRLVRVYLSDKAKAMRKEARKAFREMEEELNAVYTEAERATLRRLLLKLHDRFAPHAKDDPHHHPCFRVDEDDEDAPAGVGEGERTSA